MERCIDCFEPWIFNSAERLGTDIRVTTKDVKVDLLAEGKKKILKITAYAVRKKYIVYICTTEISKS